MNHQIKRSILVAAVACMVPAMAFASTARMSGLNVPGDYTKDYTGMFTYLSSVNSVGNLVYAEAGSFDGTYANDDRGMGAVLPNLWDGKAGVWAIHMRAYHPALGQSWWNGSINGGYGSYDPNNRDESFDLMWGHKMGSANLGLRLNRTFYSYDDGNTTTEGNGTNGRNIMGFGAGFGFDLNPNTSLEVSALFQNRSFEDPGNAKDDGGSAYLVAARAWSKTGANLTCVPVVKIWSIDQSVSDIETSTSVEDKLSGWQVGGAGNWAIGHDDLFVFGLQFVGNKEKTDTDEYTETLAPNLFMGLETHLNPWLSFRAGAQQSVFSTYKDKAEGGATRTYKESNFSFSMGTTVKLGNVTFDAVLDPAFLNNPFAQLTGGTNAVFEGWNGGGYGNRQAGYGGYGTPFPQVSLTYTW